LTLYLECAPVAGRDQAAVLAMGRAWRSTTRLMLPVGPDPNLADKNGVMPLAHARAKRPTDVARLIEQAGGRARR